MILNDVHLISMMHDLVGHDNVSFVNPASIDIRVGDSAQGVGGMQAKVDLLRYTKEDPFWLPPQAPILIATLETITIPNGYVGVIFLKSSRAREGYNHALAGFVDPGWSGKLTLEIINATTSMYLPLYPGFKIAQLAIWKMIEPALKPYEGQYKGATCVQGSYHQQ